MEWVDKKMKDHLGILEQNWNWASFIQSQPDIQASFLDWNSFLFPWENNNIIDLLLTTSDSAMVFWDHTGTTQGLYSPDWSAMYLFNNWNQWCSIIIIITIIGPPKVHQSVIFLGTEYFQISNHNY